MAQQFSDFNWHFFKAWEVSGYHDSFVTPGTRKFHTPEGMIVAIVSPLMGGKHAAKYPQGTYGTSFTAQHGSKVYMGWVIPKQGGTGAPFPDKDFAAELIKRLKRRKAYVAAMMLALLLAAPAAAQDAPKGPQLALALANAADAVSTEVAIATGAGRERNPVLGATLPQRVAVKAASTALQVWAVRALGKHHPRAAKVVGYSLAAVVGSAAAWNVGVLVRGTPQPPPQPPTPLGIVWPQSVR